jgi:hypothetical protein
MDVSSIFWKMYSNLKATDKAGSRKEKMNGGAADYSFLSISPIIQAPPHPLISSLCGS